VRAAGARPRAHPAATPFPRGGGPRAPPPAGHGARAMELPALSNVSGIRMIILFSKKNKMEASAAAPFVISVRTMGGMRFCLQCCGEGAKSVRTTSDLASTVGRRLGVTTGNDAIVRLVHKGKALDENEPLGTQLCDGGL
jgi:hypothetical protein